MSHPEIEWQNCLEEEVNILNALNQLLEKEKNILEMNAIDELNTITNKKNNLLQSLEIVEANRTQLLKKYHIDNDSEQILVFLKKLNDSAREKLCALLMEMQSLFHVIKRKNVINGKIINISQRNTRKNIELLFNADLDAEATYDEKGLLSPKGL